MITHNPSYKNEERQDQQVLANNQIDQPTLDYRKQLKYLRCFQKDLALSYKISNPRPVDNKSVSV